MQRYPVEPLRKFIDENFGSPESRRQGAGLATFLSHADRQRVCRALAAKDLSDLLADRLAILFHVGPWEIWPTWFDDALDASVEARARVLEAGGVR